MRPDDGPTAAPGNAETPHPSSLDPCVRVRTALAERARQATAPQDERFTTTPVRRAVVLVGPMGSGKSTVGRHLAGQLGLGRADADDLFTDVYGPIPEYFASHGEPAFRQREAEIVGSALAAPRPVVLSLGGGAVISATTRDALRHGPHVVHLDVEEHEALARLGGGEGRPVLAGDPARTWRRIRAERDALYREVSSWTVKTTGLDAAEVATVIADLLLEQADAAAHHAVPDTDQTTDEQHSGDAR